MSVTFDIHTVPRTDAGKGASRRLRRVGQVPGVVYGGHKEPAKIALVHNELMQHLSREAFYSQVLTLSLGSSRETVVLKDVQRHPAKPFILHVDFQRVSADTKIRMMVPLHFINEEMAEGIKIGGGVSHHITEIEISCLPKDLPPYIDIDMASMNIGDSVRMSEVPLPEGVELAYAPDPDLAVVSMHAGHGELEAEEEVGEGEEAEEEGEGEGEAPAEEP